MAERNPSDIHNVVVVGHGSSGKTTLVDHVLCMAGASNRAGSVEEGSSLSDYDPEERERQFSIESSIFNFKYEGKVFNVIDTPGYLDFTGAAAACLPAADTSLIAIDAADGVRLNTRRMWQYAENAGLARVITVTHVDGENIDYDRTLGQIQDVFGKQCVPVFLPVGTGANCSGVANLLTDDEAPGGVVGDFMGLSQSLEESIIECDDELMEKYLEGEGVGAKQLEETFKAAILNGDIVPVLCCAAEKDIGVEETLNFLAGCTPSAAEALPRKAKISGDEEVEVRPAPDGPFCAKVFKSVIDPHVGRLVYFRVMSGSISEGDSIQVARTGQEERLGKLYVIFGAKQEETGEVGPGDIACVSKVEDIKIDDTLREDGCDWVLEPMEMPEPMMSLAVEPQSRDDEQKISGGLDRLSEADPTLKVERDPQSNELVMTGMSNLHLEVLLSKLQKRYGVSAETHEPSIPYLETVTTKAEGHYKHKKQSGGRGQYGEVYLRIEPNPRGEGFEFLDETKGGVIPQQFMPAVEKGIRETMDTGVLAGYPVVDLEVVVYYGSYHDVDSSEAAFKIAGSRAFQDAFDKAKPALLEPIVRIEVTVPSEYVGDITGNLAGHRGQIEGMDQQGQMQTLTAHIPQSEVSTYSAELQSLTGGEGTFTLDFSHYEPVPSHLQQQIIDKQKKKEE